MSATASVDAPPIYEFTRIDGTKTRVVIDERRATGIRKMGRWPSLLLSGFDIEG
ncbi:hypothetical protein [Paraburkholderia elongata]|uniref:Uncharacterized protein n=1 Tax=Paraburkholderia elongata TaxID=2675747 RepID=A0A972NXE8_9BURK|nr:hypothetical protein [Paraburkholderia elongata]NPT60682.1 hypothetical protein [Paraburkholderia elongata]